MCFMERATLTTAAVEEWRPVKGYEGLYEVSNHARVRSLDRVIIDEFIENGVPCIRKRKFKGMIRKQQLTIHGYWQVILNAKGVCIHHRVHRLVAEAFIPNPNHLPCINHKDEDRTNNLPSNLEWCDFMYNNHYGTRLEKIAHARRKIVEQLTMDGQHVAYYLGVRKLCRNTNMTLRTIQRCLYCCNRYESAYGYRWRYIDVSKDEVQLATDYSLVKYQKEDTTHT